jgi:hypothetical protein
MTPPHLKIDSHSLAGSRLLSMIHAEMNPVSHPPTVYDNTLLFIRMNIEKFRLWVKEKVQRKKVIFPMSCRFPP